MKVTRTELARMVDAFGRAWREQDRANDGSVTIQRGSRRGAGLEAALKEIGIQVEK